jgi:hypothetical protein
MAGAKLKLVHCLVLKVPFACLCVAAVAQSRPSSGSSHTVQIENPQSGSLAGRLTDLRSVPLAGVSVILRNVSTGAVAHAITGRNGTFRFASLDAGEYTLEADQPHLGHGFLQGIVVSGGIKSRVQAAVQFEPPTPAMLASASPSEIASPPSALPAPQALPITSASAPHPTAPQPAILPGNAPTTSSPPLFASIATAPLRAEPSTTPASSKPHSTLETTATLNTTHPTPSLPANVTTFASHHNIALETESASIQSTLALTLTRNLSLSPHLDFALALASAPANIQTAMLGSAAHRGPIVAASQQSDLAAPVVTSTVTASQLQALPVSGRRWQEFLLDTPITTSVDSSSASFRGAGSQSSTVSVDGANLQLAFGVNVESSSASRSSDPSSDAADQQTFSNRSWTGGHGLTVSEAAIHEVTTVAGNVEAEGMRSAGGRVSLRTQSGSDSLQGQGFLFDRQNTWGARNPFTKWEQNLGSADSPNFTALPFTPPDHEMVWGLGLGSRIRRERLFWFAALDSYHRNDPGVSTVKNPAEFFNLPEPTSPNVTLLSAQLGESQNQAYNDFLGVATPGYAPVGLEQLASLLGPAPRSASQWVGFGRIDWQLAERHRLTLEGTGADWNAPGGGTTRVSEIYGNHSLGSSQASEQWLLARWEAYLTPNLLAVTQSSAGRDISHARPETPSVFEQSFLSGNFWGQLPQIVVDSRYGFTIGNPSRFGAGSYPDEKLYHAQEMLDWVHGKLLVKSGLELDHNADSTNLLRNQTGTYYYSTVAGFISDALAFQKFGLADALDPRTPHNCGSTNAKFGSQPCYSYYSQMLGPTFWRLSTNDWASFVSAQWQPSKYAVFSAGLRWELEQMPPPIAALSNPDLPLTQKLPSLGSNWGPRISLAIGNTHDRWPVLRLGYGMYFSRTQNATIETALTQTGSLRGDLNFFMRPSDDCQFCAGGAPPFPYVFAGQPASVVKPGAVEFAPRFHNPEVHQALAAIEQPLPSHILVTTAAVLSLGRRLPIAIDTNFDPAVNPGAITYAVDDPTGKGPIKSTQITVPFYASWPSPTSPTGTAGRLNLNYQQITQIMSRANSTYEAAIVRIARESRRGLSLHAHYTYSHAMDWNPNESTLVSGSDVLDPADFSKEYGVSNLDTRHSAAVIAILESPWKLHDLAGRIANGWMLSSIGQFRSGLPYSMRTSGSLPQEFTSGGTAIVGLGPGMNGSGGDNLVYGVGRNTFRYPNTWKADLRLAKRFDLGEMRQLELLAESFNLFNHQNVTQLETTGYAIESGGASGTDPRLCYLTINTTTGSASCASSTTLTGTGIPLAAFGQPLNINATNFYRERQIQLGLRMRF